MNILFVDFTNLDYSIETPYQSPLGGSQSALCYLAEELARRKHNVALLNHMRGPARRERGVTCFGARDIPPSAFAGLDAVVELNGVHPEIIDRIRPLTGKPTRFVLWSQLTTDQEAMARLQDSSVRDAWDGVALVSDWQAETFHRNFAIPWRKITVLRNAIGPAFRDLFADRPVTSSKPWPPVLCYTSTPFRGLDRLVDAFPLIRERVPGTRLRVYSSMRLYQVSAERDEFTALYDRCRATDGIDYVGPVDQASLAGDMTEINVLAYPNTFAETSCIAVMEALAAGCVVVTSDLGALRETTAGFGRLIDPSSERWDYVRAFAKAVIDVSIGLREQTIDETALRTQVDDVNKAANWRGRAKEWEEWLSQPSPQRPPGSNVV